MLSLKFNHLEGNVDSATPLFASPQCSTSLQNLTVTCQLCPLTMSNSAYFLVDYQNPGELSVAPRGETYVGDVATFDVSDPCSMSFCETNAHSEEYVVSTIRVHPDPIHEVLGDAQV
jgi:hypothetical protein